MDVDFARRSAQPELMDSGQIEYPELEACLRDLARVNGWTLAYRPTLAWFSRLVQRSNPSQTFRILDVGCGYGDMLRRLAGWARRRSVAVEFVGIDRNPWARRIAEARTPTDMPIRYVTADLFDYRPEQPFDVVISSLFAHHLTDDEIVGFLVWMDRTARRGWFINDLRRHRLPYRTIKILFPVLRLNRLVVHDGPVSVARAFIDEDWVPLLDMAGIRREKVTIERCFPFRFGVGCIR